MSKLTDYSKFDHIDVDDDDDDDDESRSEAKGATTAQATTSSTSSAPQFSMQPHSSIPHRFVLQQGELVLYEWEQTLADVTLYVAAPPTDLKLQCTIRAHHVQLGLQQQQQQQQHFFLNHATFAAVDTHESTWYKEDSVITIYLCKAAKGMVWQSPFAGDAEAQLDAVSLTKVQQQLLRERWQEENPGMDFRDAEFQGSSSTPDPRTFMGGVKYD